jgi:hypothetical protein
MTAAANACGPPDGCRSPSGHFTVSNSCGQITYQQQVKGFCYTRLFWTPCYA